MKKLLLVVCLLFAAVPAMHGQGCSICTKTANGLDDKSARGLNGGIIYLAFLPLTIMGTIGFLWWRSNRSVQ